MKTKYKYVIRLAFSAIILWACFCFVDAGEFSRALVGVHPGLFLAAWIVSVIGSILVPAMITRAALGVRRIVLSLPELVRINFTVRFYTLVFPRGVATGIRWYRYRDGGTGQDAMALVVFEKVVQIHILMLTAALFIWIDRERLPEAAPYLLGVSLTGLLLTTVGLLAFLTQPVSRLFTRALLFSRPFIPPFVYTRLVKVSEAIRAFQHLTAWNVVGIVTLSMLSYVFFIVSPFLLGLAMELDIPLRGIAWIRSLTLMLALIPVTVAGLGVREASYVAFMGLYGIEAHDALAFSVTLFVIQILIGLIGAGYEAWSCWIAPFRKSH